VGRNYKKLNRGDRMSINSKKKSRLKFWFGVPKVDKKFMNSIDKTKKGKVKK